MNNIHIKNGDLLHAKLENGAIIHGIIKEVYNNSFMIDDDISGNMFVVENTEIKEIYEIL